MVFVNLRFDHKTNVGMEKVLNRFDAIKESMQSEIRSVNDKIMTTRYLIIGLGFIITILSFVFKINP